MKKLLVLGMLMFVLALTLATPLTSSAQTSEGQAIYTKFIMGQAKCADLKDSDFLAVGNYVLNQVPESQRSVLNVYINQYKGTLSDKDYATMMGKIFTACEIPTAVGNVSADGINKGAFNYGGYGYLGMFSGLGMIWGIIKFVIGLIILIFIIKFVMRLLGGKKEVEKLMKMNKSESAEDILKERYAKGEIKKEEYEEKKKEIIK